MNLNFKFLFLLLTLAGAPALAQQDNSAGDSNTNAFISDELFVYIHSGPGKQYRILGTISAGTPVIFDGNSENDFSQITDPKGKTGWIESNYVSTSPSLRSIIAELNGKLAAKVESSANLKDSLVENSSIIEELTTTNNELNQQITSLQAKLTNLEAQVSTQEVETKKEWFFAGSIVLGIGLLLGLILPKLSGNSRRSRMNSWN